jgi:hypothetical protein
MTIAGGGQARGIEMKYHDDVHGKPLIPDMIEAVRADDHRGYERAYTTLSDLQEFLGPFVSEIGDVQYISFTQYGVKDFERGSIYPDAETRCWTPAEAMWRFRRAFIAYLMEHPAKQIAWRCPPMLEQHSAGDYVVRCRFALLGTVETPLKAVA